MNQVQIYHDRAGVVPAWTAPGPPPRGHYGRLCETLAPAPGRPKAYAFTSAASGEGVSFVARGAACALFRAYRRNVVVASEEGVVVYGTRPAPVELRTPGPDLVSLARRFRETGSREALREFEASVRQRVAERTRAAADPAGDIGCVLLDCRPLAETQGRLPQASAADGVFLVVAAGRHTRQQIQAAVNGIRESGGNLMGVVLNRRTYPVPAFLYRWL